MWICAILILEEIVEPLLIIGLNRFCWSETWFFVDEKEAIAYALVEVIEAMDMKPSDLNGWYKFFFFK